MILCGGKFSCAKVKRDGGVFQVSSIYFKGISITRCGIHSKVTAYLKFYGTQNCGVEDRLSN
jgi:hypothetical protein